MGKAKVVRIAVHGAAGRMGRAIVGAAGSTPAVEITAAIEHSSAETLGKDVAAVAGMEPCGVRIGPSLSRADFDVAIDFSRPEAALTAVSACLKLGRPIVIGTTGFSAAHTKKIVEAARKIPVCQAANYSVGVNVALKLAETAAKALGDGYDVEIVEAHHRHKVDAPSGTALALGERVAAALGRKLRDVAVYGREGQTGPRGGRTIGFATVRGGDVVGDHSVLFLGDGERVEIAHRATSRANFANGALRAAVWLAGRKPGLYSMQDVLGL